MWEAYKPTAWFQHHITQGGMYHIGVLIYGRHKARSLYQGLSNRGFFR